MGSHQIFNIGNGSPVSVKEYANLIAKYLEKEMYSKSKPLPSNELEFTNSDSSKLEEYINYKPTCNVVAGIKEMTDWFKSNRYE
jgi:UDP-glucuronate 4-epimerase